MKLSQRTLNTLVERYELLPNEKRYHGKWSYDIGVVLLGVKIAYEQTGDKQYFNYIKDTMDCYIQADGTIKNYDQSKMNIDFVNNGKLLFLLYQETKDSKYKLAMDTLYEQLQKMPRTSDGGFWHKKIYPNQMWLDGLYMGAPFYAEYLVTFKDGQGLEDVFKQFTLCYEHTVDQKTGLLYHAWDEKKSQFWADPKTGHSPNFWGRAMGWYMMALVDTMKIVKAVADFTPLQELFTKCLKALVKVQDPQSQVWYQVLDQGNRRGNYLEASASSMIVCATAKAIKLGILDDSWQVFLEKSYRGLTEVFVHFTEEGWVNLIHNCQVAGLGGEDHRDGTFVYYISEPIITNDFKGFGAFLQATLLLEPLNEKEDIQ